jgi:hypothetical protein
VRQLGTARLPPGGILCHAEERYTQRYCDRGAPETVGPRLRERRFRFAVLRRAGVPENLIKLWLGHSQNLMDLYAAQLRLDVAYRREWCEKAGLGFELGELGYNSEAPIRPALVA